ncbi:hypothetical protein [Sinomonas humi]|uniref:Uncharacterized protein n=1 Tax=Sinomonas humi TaxID=1338436 RepID=A0A0B2AKM3_9MICC|nr:hypothetical protein [Sinomonas humi]KHL04200.1 hypothetical protein LK10_06505 [Sinomonas humi]
MSPSRQALVVHPAAPDMDEEQRAALGACIDAALACTQACISGADSCLEEPAVAELRSVIRWQQNCASVCTAAVQMLSRLGSDFGSMPDSVVRMMSEACERCEEACRPVADSYLHCRITADACQAVLESVAALMARSER